MRSLVRVAASLLVAALLTGAVLVWSGVSLEECAAALGRLTFGAWATAFALHVTLYLLRAWRFALLLPDEPRLEPLPFLSVCAAHTMAALLLPAKLGEGAFVFYAHRTSRVPPSAALAALVVSRLLDLSVLAGGCGVACLVLGASGSYPAIGWFVPLGAALLALAVLLFALSARSDLLALGAGRLLRALGLGRTRLGSLVALKIGALAGGLRAARQRGRLLRAALVTLPAWLAVFLFCAVLARSLGLPAETTLAEATFGASLAILTSLLPVSAFASFGTLEAGWVLGFGALGVPRDLAAATGLGLHAVQLAHVVFLGLAGHAGMSLARRCR
jgi:hypothetical protein